MEERKSDIVIVDYNIKEVSKAMICQDNFMDTSEGTRLSKSCFTVGCFKRSYIDESTPTLVPEPSTLSVPFTHAIVEHTTSKEDSGIKDASTFLGNEMNKLSLQEREQVYEDVHGVGKSIEENDELIQSNMNKLDMEISSTRNKPAYDIAEQISYNYVQDYKLRLMFLRSCRFDARKAAKKMISFFEQKLQYFGTSKLTKMITLSDLDKEDLNCLKAGKFQLLPYRDRTGRAIVSCYLSQVYKYKSVDAMMRAFLYFWMSILEDEDTQRKGIVLLHFINDSQEYDEKELSNRATELVNTIPFYIVSGHFCIEKSILTLFMARVLSAAETAIGIRFRFHYGSQTECLFSLMTYGIPITFIPITNEGELKVDHHLKWLQRRKVMEIVINNGSMFSGIDLPMKYDVLLGKGKPIQNHTGNMHLRDLIDDCMVRYRNAKRGHKNDIVKSVVNTIKESIGGRFLKQEKDGWWYEVSDKIAIQKVSNRFRMKTVEENIVLQEQEQQQRRTINNTKRART